MGMMNLGDRNSIYLECPCDLQKVLCLTLKLCMPAAGRRKGKPLPVMRPHLLANGQHSSIQLLRIRL